jgi:hypothetical protein
MNYKHLDSNCFLVNPVPQYISQYADRNNVDMFLSYPETVKNDSMWKSFGFYNIDEYAYWSHNLCGIACILMVINALTPKSTTSVSELTEIALFKNAYSDTTAGWIYTGLIKTANEFGIDGEVYSVLTIETIIENIINNKYLVVSVNPKKIRLEETSNEFIGGHLILIFGVEISENKCTSIFINNPNGRTVQTQESVKIPISTFVEAFAGRGFSLFKSKKVKI